MKLSSISRLGGYPWGSYLVEKSYIKKVKGVMMEHSSDVLMPQKHEQFRLKFMKESVLPMPAAA